MECCDANELKSTKFIVSVDPNEKGKLIQRTVFSLKRCQISDLSQMRADTVRNCHDNKLKQNALTEMTGLRCGKEECSLYNEDRGNK